MWRSTEVALKNLKEGSGGQDKVKFLQEAAIMAQFIHPNIVTLHGVVSDKEPVSSNVYIYLSMLRCVDQQYYDNI
jgi:serine/threonine protein kinase